VGGAARVLDSSGLMEEKGGEKGNVLSFLLICPELGKKKRGGKEMRIKLLRSFVGYQGGEVVAPYEWRRALMVEGGGGGSTRWLWTAGRGRERIGLPLRPAFYIRREKRKGE